MRALESRFVVITGTDTGVGKTAVGCAVSQLLCRAGYRVCAIKPLETGCTDAGIQHEDGYLLAKSTGQHEPARALFRFRDPVSAFEAAEREARRIDFEAIVGAVRGCGQRADITLVEGAGGLLSPLTAHESLLDLALRIQAPVLLVALDKLGTQNHVLLTHTVLKHAGVPCLGVVLNGPTKPDASTGSNAKALARLLPGVPLEPLPRLPNLEDLSAAARTLLPWFVAESHANQD